MYLLRNHPVNRLLAEINSWLPEIEEESQQFTFRPRANLESREKAYVVTLELPGVKKEDVTISVENGVLNISGEKKVTTSKEESGLYLEERISGNFYRSFRLSNDVDDRNIKAEYEDGVLTITLPKKGDALKRLIEIK